MSFNVNGERYRHTTETSDKRKAQRIFDKLKAEIADRKFFEHLPAEDYTYRELIIKYLEEYSAVCKKPKSHIRDRSLAQHLVKFFGDFPILDIRPPDINDYKSQRRQQRASARTINYELSLLSHSFNIAIRDWEWLKENPVSKVTREKVRNQLERWLSVEEEQRLLSVAVAWLRPIIKFAINTGLRESEILDLKWSQIDLCRKTLTISEQKNGGIDTLPLNGTVVRLLEERAKSPHTPQDFVFPSSAGTRILHRNLFRAFDTARKKAGLEDVRFHDLRHTFASRLVQNGVDLFTVQKLGRWRTTAMIMRYAHHNTESLRPGVEALDGIGAGRVTNRSQTHEKRGHKPYLRLVTP